MTSEWINGRLHAVPDRLTMGGAKCAMWQESRTVEGWQGKVTRMTPLSLASDDPTRGEAVFVVTDTEMRGGGCGHGRHDRFGDGWHVKAKREDCPESIEFTQSGSFITHVDPAACTLIEAP